MQEKNKFPLMGLVVLAVTGFLAIMTETLPAGLLLPISSGFRVSKSATGLLVTLYAIGSIIAAIPVIAVTQSWSRKHLLMVAVSGFLIFNTVTAIATTFWLVLIARLFVGVAAGVVWGMLAGYARRMVAPQWKGRAMAIALSGTPVALSFGLPVGTWLGTLIGWRFIFVLMSGVALLLLAMMTLTLPDFAGQTANQQAIYRQVLQLPGVRPILAVTLMWMGAHNLFYTYIAPFLMARGVSRVDVTLLIFGVASLISIFVVGVLVDRYLQSLALIGLSLFAGVALFLASGVHVPWLVNGAVLLWGLSFGGAATILQTALGESVPEHALDLIMSVNATVWNVSIALGSLLGGVVLNQVGTNGFPWVVLVLAITGVLTVGVGWKNLRTTTIVFSTNGED
jgi:predicted MFS family arabinose efflux permease